MTTEDHQSEARNKRKLEVITASAETATNETEAVPQEKRLKFRNYQPYDKRLLKKAIVYYPVDTEESAAKNTTPPLDIIAQELLNVIKKQEEENGGKVDINIAPKKINFDLKNQIQNKLDKLKRRTQRAIVEILREKLAAEEAEDSD